MVKLNLLELEQYAWLFNRHLTARHAVFSYIKPRHSWRQKVV
ncbi:hypothetical protein QUB30_30985 [Microcoleus sp. BROC3]